MDSTGELGYDGLNGTRKIGPSYAKSVVYIWRILDMHRTGTKHIVRHMQKSVVQWSVISKFTCTVKCKKQEKRYNSHSYRTAFHLSHAIWYCELNVGLHFGQWQIGGGDSTHGMVEKMYSCIHVYVYEKCKRWCYCYRHALILQHYYSAISEVDRSALVYSIQSRANDFHR